MYAYQGINMENAKNIIATFLKVDSSDVNENTLIDSSAIPGSVLIHRMYSTLSAEGYHVINQDTIKTYGDFLTAMNQGTVSKDEKAENPKKETSVKIKATNNSSSMQVGIDIEDIMNMPVATDYREERFYTDNFSSKEISYCILQADPRASFAGKFSLKEAIIKADNDYKSVAFTDIEILNDNLGKPLFNSFSLSISHTRNQSIAVAIKGSITINTETPDQPQITKEEIKDIVKSLTPTLENHKPSSKINYLSFVLSLVAIGSVIYQNL